MYQVKLLRSRSRRNAFVLENLVVENLRKVCEIGRTELRRVWHTNREKMALVNADIQMARFLDHSALCIRIKELDIYIYIFIDITYVFTYCLEHRGYAHYKLLELLFMNP